MVDLQLANQLTGDDDLTYDVYRPLWPNDSADVRFKVFAYRQMSLADAMPHLSVLGVEVLDERPFEFKLRGRDVYLYDFGLKLSGAADRRPEWTPELQARFIDTFDATYRGRAESGKFNRLVTGGLTWQEIAWLRAMSRYLVQAGIPYSQPYVAATLNDNPVIAAALVRAFRTDSIRTPTSPTWTPVPRPSTRRAPRSSSNWPRWPAWTPTAFCGCSWPCCGR